MIDDGGRETSMFGLRKMDMKEKKYDILGLYFLKQR